MLAYFARLIVFAIVTLTTIPSSRDTKRRNCWPAPFDCPDRQTVRAPFVIMVHNGWRKQNMLSDFHFESTTGQLTEAGKLKIRWIILEAPVQHREIYVHIGQTPEETQTRLAAVTAQAATLVPQNEIPPIMQTSISDTGAPADRVDLIERKYQSSMPSPRLPSASGQSGGSGTSGGGP